jgi:hypothetical protein
MEIRSFRDAERLIHLWGLFERGFSEGMSEAIQAVDELLCGESTTIQQREVLLMLSDSLRKARKNRIFGDSWK